MSPPPPRRALAPGDCHVIIPAAGCSRRLARLTAEQPKSMLPVAGKPIIEHGLQALAERGFPLVTLVVGYRRERLVEHLGGRYRDLRIDYVVCEDFERAEHGWSVYLTRASWELDARPVVLLDADNLYAGALLDALLAAPHDDLVLVDADPAAADREEEIVLGERHRVDGFVRGRARGRPGAAGVFVGMCRFSPAFMARLYDYMQGLFLRHGRGFKYERVFDRLVRAGHAELRYATTDGRPWININDEADYQRAQALADALHAPYRRPDANPSNR